MSGYVIEVSGLAKEYNGKAVLHDVCFRVEKGTVYGLLGNNGAGKSTTLKILTGLTRATAGTVNVFGEVLTPNSKTIPRRIGAMIETPGFYPNLTGTENLTVFAKIRGQTKPNAIPDALALVGLPYRDKKRYEHYSLGMKQRLSLARAIMHEPELLILDEPANGLDPSGMVELRDMLRRLKRERNTTILISSHILTEIEQIADTIGIIHDGKTIDELSVMEMKQNNRRYYLITVSSASAAARILEQDMSVQDFTVLNDFHIRVYEMKREITAITRSLVLGGVDISGIELRGDTLEDYFQKITQKGGIRYGVH
jgi:bacitracin transport system ATP-binding protein